MAVSFKLGVKQMEKFFNLSTEKQQKIVDAALASFGANGYKKTSIRDIAAEAGISKAMIFHYFGTKKQLYLYFDRVLHQHFYSRNQTQIQPVHHGLF
jgi:AcrR family transcriptional regulator